MNDTLEVPAGTVVRQPRRKRVKFDAAEVAENEAKFQARKRSLSDAVEKAQSKAGSRKLKLPPLLDQRRLQYAMPDGCFKAQAVYDRILVWQIPPLEGEKAAKGSRIYMPETTQAKIKDSCPRGIIVSAGMDALDTLRSNGMDVGHIIGFINLAPYRKAVEVIEGHAFSLIILRVGEILDSEDLRAALLTGHVQVRFDEEQNKHYYYDKKAKKRWNPAMPWQSDEC